jgi:5-formyltetrahydrofolate cyclo-ligase
VDQFSDKESARQAIWDHLQEARLAAFPFPPHGRIPNFVGAADAARRLFEHEPFASARRLKVNPDAPQRYVRLLALQRGVTVYMPTPRLRAGFMCLDPAKIAPEHYRRAVSLSGCSEFAQDVALDELPHLDAIVTGSVAVTRAGTRCGKGEGYGDLEYAILRELGHPAIPVATTVHDSQVVAGFPSASTDLALSLIVTPTRSILVVDPPAPPAGIDWAQLSPERIREMPPLLAMWERAQQS